MSHAAQDMSFVFVCFLDSYCCPCSMLDKIKHDLFLAAIGIESYNKATRWHTYWCSTPPRSVISCLRTQKICFPFWRGFLALAIIIYIYTYIYSIMNWTVTKNQAQHSTQHIYFFLPLSCWKLHPFSWIPSSALLPGQFVVQVVGTHLWIWTSSTHQLGRGVWMPQTGGIWRRQEGFEFTVKRIPGNLVYLGDGISC